MIIVRFNPRAHVGRDLKLSSSITSSKSFNPRAHVGRDVYLVLSYITYSSFNPRAHVGRDFSAVMVAFTFSVSIHAPTWGATSYSHLPTPWPLFQSTRPRGARPSARCPHPPVVCFNPRAHVGRDGQPRGGRHGYGVSIHAPTWGATKCSTTSAPTSSFQSTRPRGARLAYRLYTLVHSGFNPRAHVGRDKAAQQWQATDPVSIHAPTWGATSYSCTYTIIRIVSIHAPTWGATAYSVNV